MDLSGHFGFVHLIILDMNRYRLFALYNVPILKRYPRTVLLFEVNVLESKGVV